MLLMYPVSSLSILITSVLNSASDRLLISILFSSFSGALFCYFIWSMFLCLLILAASLCLFLCIWWSWVYCGPLKGRLLGIPQFLLLPQPPLGFTARSNEDLSSWHWNPRLGCLVWGWDPSLPRYHSQFLSTTHGCWTSCSTSPCISTHLCIFVPPTHLDECDFLNSLVVGLLCSSVFWLFWVIVVL